MTVQACLDAAVRLLEDAGFPLEPARQDAAVLARHVLGWTLTEWATGRRDEAPASLMDRLTTLARRRASHEPVAYLTGSREFYGRAFRVTPAVLIPRPETEGVIDAVASSIGELSHHPLVADVGTGSGCLAITLALEWPGMRVIGTDTSPDALAIARENARALGASAVEFVEASLVPAGRPPLDLIVSNPPYVPARDRASLSPDVRDFEPAAALFGGDDGLDVVRQLLPAAAGALRPGGRLVLEIGQGLAAAATSIAAGAGFDVTGVRPDLQGIPRILTARLRG